MSHNVKIKEIVLTDGSIEATYVRRPGPIPTPDETIQSVEETKKRHARELELAKSAELASGKPEALNKRQADPSDALEG